jgi:hypothetical protein
MVDFNSETTVGLARKDILTMIVMERLYNTIGGLEEYHKFEYSGGSGNIALPKQRLLTLFNTLQPALEKSLKKELYFELVLFKNSEDINVIERSFQIINQWLYDKNLTKLDDRPTWNRFDLEADNQANFLK